MLKHLRLTNFLCHRDLAVTFAEGFNVITGANATGKSTLLEAIRFALAGAGALRGNVTDVKGARVRLEFSVRGAPYAVERTARDATLSDAGGVIATGTRPVNARIAALFGYGLDVFDVAHCTLQGEIEALSAMRAAERRRLVDSTVGLSRLDALMRDCAEEAAGLGRELDGLRAALPVVGEPPPPPADPRSVEDLEQARQALQAAATRRAALLRELAEEPEDPGPPPDCAEPRSLSVLEELQNRALTLEARLDELRARLARAASRYDPPRFTPDMLALAEKGLASRAFLDALPRPEHDAAFLDGQERLLDDLHAWETWHDLARRGRHTCPACRHSWPVEAERMATLGDWEGVPKPAPRLTRQQVAQGRRALARFAAIEQEWERHAAEVVRLRMEHPEVAALTAQEVHEEYMAHKARAETQELTRECEALFRERQALGDVTGALAARRQYRERHLQWQRAVERHRAWRTAEAGRRAELARLPENPEAELEAVSAALVEARVHARALRDYEAAVARRAELDRRIAEREARRDGYLRARAALAELRSRVKSHLVPSLSRLASLLVERMTNGGRSRVEVDEEFDIRLDGQPVETLSGSEKAAVNLALRIALGQVLTHRVFPVMLFDEPDAAMDLARAAATAECLRDLPGQVVLVTHKRPDSADMILELAG
jgi:exonuclease SbcC